MKTEFLYHKSALKAAACLLGYCIWLILSASHPITCRIAVPVYLYNIPKNTTVQAPDTVQLELRGSRTLMHQLHAAEPTVHVNAALLHEGNNNVPVTSAMIFLPPSIHMVNSRPLVLAIKLITNEQGI